ncbi:hypothetical protein REPUB_Repub13aG0035800 [Reevesia pubescens]
MPPTFRIIVLGFWGLLLVVIIVLTIVFSCDKYFRQRRLHRPSQDIETSRTKQTQPSQSQNQQGEASTSRPIMVVYKIEQETESNCSDCAIGLEEFKEGDCCRILSKCKHIYHQLCMDQWLVKNSHYPLCHNRHQPLIRIRL